MLTVTTSLAAAACSGPTSAWASGIALHLEVPCCDARNGTLSIEYPPAIRIGYDVDLSGATEGGGIDVPLEMRTDVVAGTAQWRRGPAGPRLHGGRAATVDPGPDRA